MISKCTRLKRLLRTWSPIAMGHTRQRRHPVGRDTLSSSSSSAAAALAQVESIPVNQSLAQVLPPNPPSPRVVCVVSSCYLWLGLKGNLTGIGDGNGMPRRGKFRVKRAARHGGGGRVVLSSDKDPHPSSPPPRLPSSRALHNHFRAYLETPYGRTKIEK